MAPLRIVVVEDDVLIGMLLAEMLESMGHEVCEVASTEAGAIAAAARWNPQLMIVDARLREGSGISAIEVILRTVPMPHVFVTGDIAGLRAQLPDAIAIEKPFGEAGLAQAIQRAVGATDASP
jgi:two-component system, response regulator PdtaR